MEEKECAICQTREGLKIHHLKPLSQGGTDDETNRVYLCSKCHTKRHYGTPHKGKINGNRDFRLTKAPVATFYVGDFRVEWQKFRSICIKDGSTASAKLKAFIINYVESHDILQG